MLVQREPNHNDVIFVDDVFSSGILHRLHILLFAVGQRPRALHSVVADCHFRGSARVGSLAFVSRKAIPCVGVAI